MAEWGVKRKGDNLHVRKDGIHYAMTSHSARGRELYTALNERHPCAMFEVLQKYYTEGEPQTWQWTGSK